MKLNPTFDINDFLVNHWQTKPLVIRGGIEAFVDPIDEHELAGFAMEPDIDSRVVSNSDGQWSVEHGPFEDFQQLQDSAWSLLVQGVNLIDDNTQALMTLFNFLPNWRTDDVMVSFSVEGAGVGPHIDQYDVFIVQGKGSRRWQVGEKKTYDEVFPHPDLRQISGFVPIIDEVLHEGDIIYIPPGYPHNGVALDNCLNYSIGFRAPSQSELISAFADFLIEQDVNGARYGDKGIATRPSPSLIKAEEIETFRQLMKDSLDGPCFTQWLGTFLSKNNYLDPAESDVSEPVAPQQVADFIADGGVFMPNPEAAPVVYSRQGDTDAEWVLALGDAQFFYPKSQGDNLFELINSPQWPQQNHKTKGNSLFFNQLLSTLVNTGYWYPVT